MAKKFSLLLAAMAVVAFAVPALASAGSPEVTINGAKATVGSEIVGTSTNTVTKTSIGNLSCAEVVVNAELTANTGSTVEALANEKEAKTATCFFKGSTPITIHDATLLRLHSGAAHKGTADLTFVATLPKGLVCHYIGTAVPFEYTTTTDLLHLKGALTVTPEACGTASIEGTFTLTSPLGAVVLH